jgi:hypothetical protein
MTRPATATRASISARGISPDNDPDNDPDNNKE